MSSLVDIPPTTPTVNELFYSLVADGQMLQAFEFWIQHYHVIDVNKSGAFACAITNRNKMLVALMFLRFSETMEYPEERLVEGLELAIDSVKIVMNQACSRMLVHSALFGWYEMAELLVNRGVNVNAQVEGMTPLGAAIAHSQFRIFTLLLDHGAGMYHADPERTAFDAAIVFNNYDMLVELIKRGGNINKQGRRGRTPLMIAAEHNRYEMAVLLLAHGADVNVQCDDRTTALIAGGNMNMMRLLVDTGAEFIHPESGETALMSACMVESFEGPKPLETVKNLLALGFDDINHVDGLGRTALMIASWTDPDIVKLLLDRGAKVHSTCQRGWNALHSAVRHDNISFLERKLIIELLLDHGADIHSRDREGSTPLLLASRNLPDASTVTLLLSKGACANDRDRRGLSCLMFAVAKSDEEMVSVLLDYGANMFSRTKRGTTALKRARSDFVNRGIKQQLVYHESTRTPWDLFSLST